MTTEIPQTDDKSFHFSQLINCFSIASKSPTPPPPYDSWRNGSIISLPPPLPAHRKVARLVAKNGKPLLDPKHMPNLFRVVRKNWFLLLVEQKWRAVLFFCTLIFALSWIIFALLYYLILLIMNGKAVPDPTTACGVSGTPCGVNANGTVDEPHTRTCIANVDTLLDALLFSIETQHTIGYGYRYITTGCWPGYILWMIQLIVGYFLQTVLVCVIVAKVVRPKKRRAEIRFSKRAVIGELDSDDCRPTLMIRMADIQQDLNLTETHIKLYMATWKTNKNGCRVLIGLRDMDVGYDHGWDRVLLLWPITIRHIVDEKSPLYGLDEKSLQTNDFELILTLDSGVEATGMTFQARTSFVADEIDWGYNFSPMVRMNEKKNKWEIDYDLFDQVESCGQLEIASRSLPPEKYQTKNLIDGPNVLLKRSGFV